MLRKWRKRNQGAASSCKVLRCIQTRVPVSSLNKTQQQRENTEPGKKSAHTHTHTHKRPCACDEVFPVDLCATEAPFIPFHSCEYSSSRTQWRLAVRWTVVGNRFLMSCNYMPNKQGRIYNLKTLIFFLIFIFWTKTICQSNALRKPRSGNNQSAVGAVGNQKWKRRAEPQECGEFVTVIGQPSIHTTVAS